VHESNGPMCFNASRVLSRSCESLLGICNGLLADEVLNEKEVRFLDLWLRDNSAISSVWPGSAIASRVSAVLADGVVTQVELSDLRETLSKLLGGSLEQTGVAGGLSTRLPVDESAQVTIAGRSFCFTGKFVRGPRSECERIVSELGGLVFDNVTLRLDYLVIGTLISPDWAFSSHGRKIEKAKEVGRTIIVHEEQWAAAVDILEGT
jgi:NAD-dependent DNA ligase